jgi:hypothetical protein
MAIPLPEGWKTFTDGDGDCSTPPVPPEPVPTKIIQTCDDVFAWNEGRDTPVIWTVPGPDCGVHGDQGEWYDTALVLEVNTSPTCYGIIDVAPPLLACERDNLEGFLVWQASFQIVIGTPRFGICAWIQESTDSEHVTLFGLIVDVSALTIGIYQWTDMTLLNLAVLPAATYVTSYVPVFGDVLSLTIEQFPSFPFTGPIGDVYDSSNNFKLELPTDFNGGFDGIPVMPFNWHVGFIAVGDSPPGTALFFPSTVFDNCGVGPVQHTAHLFIEKDYASGAACAKIKFSYHYTADPSGVCQPFFCDIQVEAGLYDAHDCGGLPMINPNSTLLPNRGTVAWTMTGGVFDCPGFCDQGLLHVEGSSISVSNAPGNCPPDTGCCGPSDGGPVHIKYEYTPNDPVGEFISIEFDINPTGLSGSIYVPAMDYVTFRSHAQIAFGCCPCSETLPFLP